MSCVECSPSISCRGLGPSRRLSPRPCPGCCCQSPAWLRTKTRTMVHTVSCAYVEYGAEQKQSSDPAGAFFTPNIGVKWSWWWPWLVWWHHLGSQIYKKWSQKPKVVFGSTSIWWFPLLCWYCYGLVRTKLLQWSLQSCRCTATAGVWRCALGNTTLRDIWHILPRKYQPCVNYLFPGWAGCWGGVCSEYTRETG